MKIICRSNTGVCLSEGHTLLGYTKESQFSLIIGREYRVHAMSIWRAALMVLLLDESNLPNWYPIEAFDVLDGRLSETWYFRKFRDDHSLLEAIWGYQKIVLDPSHYDALIERVPEALRVFRDATSD